MKILRLFLGFVFRLIILAVGLWLIAGYFGAQCPELAEMLADPARRAAFGGAMVLLVVIYWLASLPRGKEEKAVSYECENGKVSVSVKAINSLLSRLAGEFAAIVSLRASVNPRDKSVRLDLTVKSGARVLELSQALQERVRESMRQNLGITEIGSIRVFVREIAPADDSGQKNSEDHNEWQNMPM